MASKKLQGLSLASCDISFLTHFRSCWHKFNEKASVLGKFLPLPLWFIHHGNERYHWVCCFDWFVDAKKGDTGMQLIPFRIHNSTDQKQICAGTCWLSWCWCLTTETPTNPTKTFESKVWDKSKVNIWKAHVRPNSWSLMLKCIMNLNPESIDEILRLTITRTGQPYTNLTEQFFLFSSLGDIHLWKRSMLLWTSDLLSNIHIIQHFTTTLQAKQC